jgi:hypothetical protein
MNPKVLTHAAEKLCFGQSNEKIATFISNRSYERVIVVNKVF